ncbi:hypothetical protein MTR_8g096660 [Medicago truncatula]|uniref:Uncharacterized protein n=1 Tax=Medicago truncatula TaxID=3880 RepID=A0A072TVW3_MEDTR|nr:hypothetical protein MTR_8g096660 [Medicago truncatula]
MPQMRWMLSGKKDRADAHDAVNTNLCNSSLFQFYSKRVLNLDIIETTYSRTELASVANLIRNWIDIKTVDSLIFVVMDRVRKSLQARVTNPKFSYMIDMNNPRLAGCEVGILSRSRGMILAKFELGGRSKELKKEDIFTSKRLFGGFFSTTQRFKGIETSDIAKANSRSRSSMDCMEA